MINAQERARAIIEEMNNQRARIACGHDISLAQVEAETWEQAAKVAEEFSKPYNLDWWEMVTKKEVSAQICRDVAAKLRQQAQRAKEGK